MDVLLVGNVVLIELVQINRFLAMGCAQQLHEIFQELLAKVLDVFFRVFADDEHLTNVKLAHGVLFEAVLFVLPCQRLKRPGGVRKRIRRTHLVPHLSFTDLAVKPKKS